jgi:hypothetical protein
MQETPSTSCNGNFGCAIYASSLVRAVCPATVSTIPLMNVFDAIPLKPANVLRRRSRIAVRRSPVHGRGVFATRALAPGELICEYLGERIAWDEAVLRHPRDPAHPDHTFYFDVGDGTVIVPAHPLEYGAPWSTE